MALERQRTAGRHIVIGSGPCGASVARALAERGAEVTILERGEAVTDPPGSHLRNSERHQRDPDGYFGAIGPYMASPGTATAGTTLPAAQVTHAVGGQGIVWTNNCPRTMSGLERWDRIDDDEWGRLYVEAERYLMVEPARQSQRQERIKARLQASWPDRLVADQPFAGRFVDPRRVEYVAPSDVLGPVADRVEVARSEVRRVVVEDGRAAGVETDDATLASDGVVVAAGALDTPLILGASGVRLPALGRWLTYHEVLVTQVVLDDALVQDDDVKDYPPRLMLPPDADHPWHIMVLRDTNPLVPAVPDERIDDHRLVEIQAFCPIDPRARNRIDPATGAFEVERSQLDEWRMDETMRNVDAIVASLGRSRAGCEPQWLPAGAHVMGTTRIGADASDSVADGFGRVHGLEGLWLATVGLIPTRVAVNPTLTGVALAIRTAEAMTRSRG